MKKNGRRSTTRILRRVVITTTSLLLVACLAAHLYGRLRLATARSNLESALGFALDLDKANLPPPGELALAAFGDDADIDARDWPTADEAYWAPVDRWSPEIKNKVRHVVERHRTDLDRWHQNLPGTSDGMSDDQTQHSDDSPSRSEALRLFRLVKLVKFDGQLALDDGDLERAIDAASTIARASACFHDEPWLISSLLGIATEKKLLALVRELLEDPRSGFDDAILNRLTALSPTSESRHDARQALAGEAIFSIALLGEGRRAADVGPIDSPLYLLFGRAAAAERLAAIHRAVERIPVPYGELTDQWSDVRHRTPFLNLITVIHWWLESQMSLREAFDYFQRANSPLEANYLDTVVKHQIVASQRQLVRAAILLRRIGLAEGSYPDERPRVAPLEIPDPFTGKRILYRPQDDGSLVLEHDGGLDLVRRFLSGMKENPEMTVGAVFRIHLPPIRPHHPESLTSLSSK